ncbi:putative transcription factor MADS-type1 family [Dioscorea sansibarensis]
MGRNKVPMEKINKEANLHATYSKRKLGLVKKTYELSILSDVDAAFLSVSGAGRVGFFSGASRFQSLFLTFPYQPNVSSYIALKSLIFV